MLTKEHANTLRVIAHHYSNDQTFTSASAMLADIASIIENQVNIAAADDAKRQALQDIGKGAAESIAEMVAALECDYDRLEELRTERTDWLAENPGNYLEANDPRAKAGAHWALAFPDESEELADLTAAAGDCESQDDARERIQDDPLSIELNGTWVLGGTPEADRAYILLGTGGPATRIVCELDDSEEPTRAWIEAQDWGTPWTEYRGDAVSSDDLLTYCRCFYFGEG